MKKNYLIISILFLTLPLISSTNITILTNPYEKLKITLIEPNSNHISIDNNKILKANSNGIIEFLYNTDNQFDLILENKYYKKIFHEEFNNNFTGKIEFYPDSQSPLIANSKILLFTGYSIYENKKTTILPIYYTLIAFFSLLLFLALAIKKNKQNNKKLIKEATNILHNQNLQKTEEKSEITKENLEKPKEESLKKEIKEEIKEQEIEIENNEVFKESEEKLIDELEEDAKEPKKTELNGQPSPEKNEREETKQEL